MFTNRGYILIKKLKNTSGFLFVEEDAIHVIHGVQYVMWAADA